MSAYLSAANKVANTARGQATAAAKRQAKTNQTQMTNAWLDMVMPKPVRKTTRKTTGKKSTARTPATRKSPRS